ncbi:hypothetical protein AHAS_Ahas06G0009900 [Arachis hypogaea]
MAYISASTRTILFLSRSTTKLFLFPFKPSFSSSSSSSSSSSHPSLTLHFTTTKCTLQHQPQTLLRRNVIEVLEERGLLDSTTNDSALRSSAAANSPPLKVYCGFDPTAESLHLGNLLGIIVLSWFRRCGHQPVALIGGATARVGDPSGKSLERPELDAATLERNTAGISQTIKQILGRSLNSNLEGSKVVILNNYDWWKEFSLLEFLKKVGKYARVGSMIAKESVRKRLESEQGMSYTELTYQLLQGYDFLYLFQNEGVNVQIGGSDQWGNITAGTELIRKILQVEGAYGLTFPLLLKSDGTKFGKSEDGAIWLSPAMLSPYKFYQYFFTVPDADVIRFLKILTFLDIEEIAALEGEMKKPGYVPNTAQRRLAEEVTRFVHGDEGLTEALKATEALRPGSETKLDWKTIEGIAEGVPSCSLAYDSVLNLSLVDLSVSSGLFESKSAARRLLKQGGLYLNNNRVDSENKRIEEADIVDGKVLLISAGKKNKNLLWFVWGPETSLKKKPDEDTLMVLSLLRYYGHIFVKCALQWHILIFASIIFWKYELKTCINSVDELRELFENWHPLSSKFYFVMQAEPLIINILQKLKASQQCLPDDMTSIIKEAINEQLEGEDSFSGVDNAQHVDPVRISDEESVDLVSQSSTSPSRREASNALRSEQSQNHQGGIPLLVEVVELGSTRGKENAAAALLHLNMVLQEGAVPPLVALSPSGTARAKEKFSLYLLCFVTKCGD